MYGFEWLLSKNRKNKNCLNQENRDQYLLVTLTSFPGRINIVHKTIRSILNQEVIKPDSVELWLAGSQFPKREKELPRELLKLTKLGLNICWCEDIRSFKKLIPALMVHPLDVIVTADDDVFYKRDWLKKLYTAYLKDKKSIHCHKATKFYIDDGNRYCAIGGGKDYYPQSSYLNKLVGVGGVLYPAGSLNEEIFNSEVFQKYAPTNDDIWFWFMAVMNNTRIAVVEGNTPKPIEIYERKKSAKLTSINDSGENLFWAQFINLLMQYPEVDLKLKKEYSRWKSSCIN